MMKAECSYHSFVIGFPVHLERGDEFKVFLSERSDKKSPISHTLIRLTEANLHEEQADSRQPYLFCVSLFIYICLFCMQLHLEIVDRNPFPVSFRLLFSSPINSDL